MPECLKQLAVLDASRIGTITTDAVSQSHYPACEQLFSCKSWQNGQHVQQWMEAAQLPEATWGTAVRYVRRWCSSGSQPARFTPPFTMPRTASAATDGQNSWRQASSLHQTRISRDRTFTFRNCTKGNGLGVRV